MEYLKYFENKTSAEGYKTESWFVGYLDEEDLVLYSGGGEVIKDGEMVMDEVTLAGRTFPNNVIAYISMDGNPIEFSGSSYFKPTFVEHIFDEKTKIGQLVFSGDVTQISLLKNLSLKELWLPETITKLYQKGSYGSTYKIFSNTTCNKLYYNCASATWSNSNFYGFDNSVIEELIIGINVRYLPTLYQSNPGTVRTLELNTVLSFTNLLSSLRSLRKHLSTIKVTTNSSYIDSRNNCNGVVDSTTNTLLLGCPSTTIPSTVTAIGEEALSGCVSGTLIIPDNVVTLYKSAFKDSSIEYVKLSDSMKSTGESAFKGCGDLRTIVFGANTVNISASSFSNSGVEQIVLPDTVRLILSNAFETCENLTHLTFGHDLTKIGSRALAFCAKLENIYYNGTKAEWNAVEKYTQENYEWYYLIPATVVHCIDGDVTL